MLFHESIEEIAIRWIYGPPLFSCSNALTEVAGLRPTQSRCKLMRLEQVGAHVDPQQFGHFDGMALHTKDKFTVFYGGKLSGRPLSADGVRHQVTRRQRITSEATSFPFFNERCPHQLEINASSVAQKFRFHKITDRSFDLPIELAKLIFCNFGSQTAKNEKLN